MELRTSKHRVSLLTAPPGWHDQLEIGEEVVAEDPKFSAEMWLAAELLVCFPEDHSALGVTDGCAEDGHMPGPLGSVTPFHFYDTRGFSFPSDHSTSQISKALDGVLNKITTRICWYQQLCPQNTEYSAYM